MMLKIFCDYRPVFRADILYLVCDGVETLEFICRDVKTGIKFDQMQSLGSLLPADLDVTQDMRIDVTLKHMISWYVTDLEDLEIWNMEEDVRLPLRTAPLAAVVATDLAAFPQFYCKL
jgi:hypothetical protein